VVLLLLLVALAALAAYRAVLASRATTPLLVGVPVDAFTQTADGLGCLTCLGNLWTTPGAAARPGAAVHFGAPVVGGPATSGDLLIAATADGALTAWQPSRRVPAWRRQLDARAATGPAVRDRLALLPQVPAALACLDAESGKLLWWTPLSAPARMPPIWCAGYWLILDRCDQLVLLTRDGQFAGWQALPGPLLAAAADGDQLWLSLAPDQAVVWTARGFSKPVPLGSPSCLVAAGSDAALYALSDGGLVCLATGGVGTTQLWRRRGPGLVTCLAGPLSLGGAALWAVGAADGTVALFEARTGRAAGVLRPGSSPVRALAADGQELAVATEDGAWLCRLTP
jgi:outer membrane protein assembly factor BamB